MKKSGASVAQRRRRKSETEKYMGRAIWGWFCTGSIHLVGKIYSDAQPSNFVEELNKINAFIGCQTDAPQQTQFSHSDFPSSYSLRPYIVSSLCLLLSSTSSTSTLALSLFFFCFALHIFLRFFLLARLRRKRGSDRISFIHHLPRPSIFERVGDADAFATHRAKQVEQFTSISLSKSKAFSILNSAHKFKLFSNIVCYTLVMGIIRSNLFIFMLWYVQCSACAPMSATHSLSRSRSTALRKCVSIFSVYIVCRGGWCLAKC